MPEPTRTPVPVQAPSVAPDEEYEANPERLCPEQRERLTREIAPLLPE